MVNSRLDRSVEDLGLRILDDEGASAVNGGGWWGDFFTCFLKDMGDRFGMRAEGTDEDPTCFVGETLITLDSGEALRLDQFSTRPRKPGVLRADGAPVAITHGSKCATPQPVLFVMTADGRTLGVTEAHPMVVRSARGPLVVPARDLWVGEDLLVFTGKGRDWDPMPIVSIERRVYEGDLYNIAVEGDGADGSHLIVANGIVTGDLFLQLPIEARTRVEGNTVATDGDLAIARIGRSQ